MSNLFKQLEDQLEKGVFTPSAGPSSNDIYDYRKNIQFDMLRETVTYAAEHVPYYSRIWKSQGISVENIHKIEDLNQFPIIYKSDVLSKRKEFVSRKVRIATFRCTSGTTGLRMPLPVSREEIDDINQFGSLRALASGAPKFGPIVLRVVTPVRRIASDTGGSGRGPVITAFLNLDASDQRFKFDYFDHILQCLIEHYPVSQGSDRVEVLWSCPPFLIRALTEGLLKRTFNHEMTFVRNIVCSGGVITNALCNYVKKHWDADLHGFYSLTEIAGSHPRCPLTGHYHFDISAIADILNPGTLRSVEPNEEGVLVLTSLLPFQRAQPMIRYWTDDIFTLKDRKCDCGFRGVSGIFRGRTLECLDLSSILPPNVKPRIVGAADILEVLEWCPELPQFHKNPKFNISLVKNDASDPKFCLTVESFPLNLQDQEGLVRKIKEGLFKIFSMKGYENFFKNFFIVRLARKGELDNTINYYPDR